MIARRRWLLGTLVLPLTLVAACRREVRPSGADGLAGYIGRLALDGELRLELQGTVDDSPAQVVLEVASPLSTVTTGCFLRGGNPPTRGRVRAPKLDGGWIELPEVVVSGARMGSVQLADRLAGLLTSDGRCVLMLGSDALAPFALQIDPERREVAIAPSRSRDSYRPEANPSRAPSSAEEQLVLELARDPRADWPFLSARILQGGIQAAATFMLSTAAEQSIISESAAAQAGLQSEGRVLDGIALPEEAKQPQSNPARFRVDALQLSPSVGVRDVLLEGRSSWSNPAAIGVIGGDVWGRFRVTLDLQAGVLILRRPRVVNAGARQLCAAEDGEGSEERCFALRVLKLGDSLAALATIWRELPEGARLHLDPVGTDGRPIVSDCRFGLTFTQGDRGMSTAQQFPWPAMERTFPACAGVIRQAESFALGLFEEGALNQCPGQCAFVRHLATSRVSCQCANSPGRAGGTRARAAELYRRLQERRNTPPATQEEPEPSPQ